MGHISETACPIKLKIELSSSPFLIIPHSKFKQNRKRWGFILSFFWVIWHGMTLVRAAHCGAPRIAAHRTYIHGLLWEKNDWQFSNPRIDTGGTVYKLGCHRLVICPGNWSDIFSRIWQFCSVLRSAWFRVGRILIPTPDPQRLHFLMITLVRLCWSIMMLARCSSDLVLVITFGISPVHNRYTLICWCLSNLVETIHFKVILLQLFC